MGSAKWWMAFVLVMSALMLPGCKPSDVKEGTDNETGAPGASADDVDEAATIAANMGKLSAEDRAIAEKQKVCPVTDQPLGGMAVPFKVTVKDRDVFLCCAGCEKDITDNPDKFLAKLSE